jgi:hypothetical protein
MRYATYYLVEARPALAERLAGRVEQDFADALLEPQLYRRFNTDRSMWFEAQRLAQTKLLFLASLCQYDPLASEDDFASVFGSAQLSVGLFDGWFVVRELMLDDDLEQLERYAQPVVGRIKRTGLPVVDEWLSELAQPSEGQAINVSE